MQWHSGHVGAQQMTYLAIRAASCGASITLRVDFSDVDAVFAWCTYTRHPQMFLFLFFFAANVVLRATTRARNGQPDL